MCKEMFFPIKSNRVTVPRLLPLRVFDICELSTYFGWFWLHDSFGNFQLSPEIIIHHAYTIQSIPKN